MKENPKTSDVHEKGGITFRAAWLTRLVGVGRELLCVFSSYFFLFEQTGQERGGQPGG